jgi:hypothetical protein
VRNFGIPRWAILLFGAGLVLFGIAVSQGWIRDPSLAKSDYVGTIDVSAEDAKLYRAVPFEWQVTAQSGSFKGNDTAYVRIDPSGERGLVCGWLKLDKGGASIRATRWLSEARIKVGDLRLGALHRTDRQTAGQWTERRLRPAARGQARDRCAARLRRLRRARMIVLGLAKQEFA